MEIVEIIDTFKAPLHRCKNLYQLFDFATVSTNKQYQFAPDQQIEHNIITGIDVGYFSGTAYNYPTTISVNGKVYNTIVFADLAKVLISLRDKDNKYLLRRTPIAAFRRDLVAELRIYELDLSFDSSFLEFVDTPLVTALPMVIPFNFFWNDYKRLD